MTSIVESHQKDENKPNLYPIYKYVTADDLTVHKAYLKLAKLNDPKRSPSFLFESAVNGDTVDRYSFIGLNPRKVIKTGENEELFPKEHCNVDPITVLENELAKYNQIQL